MKTKKILCVVLSVTLIISTIIFTNVVEVSANDKLNGTYVGTYADSIPMEFEITSVDLDSGTFEGNVIITNNSVILNINKNVAGTIRFYDNHYVCEFMFSYHWWITSYSATFTISIDPQAGMATGNGGGGILLEGNLSLSGTPKPFYNKKLSYSEDDMKLCMSLSRAIYEVDDINKKNPSQISNDIIKNINKVMKSTNDNDLYIVTQNEIDSNSENVSFAILNRIVDESTMDIIVVVRGTLKDEWQGNVQISGTAYQDIPYHYNFELAKESIKGKIQNYYDNYKNKFEKINLIITGHSRGAAVSNLYAKNATDVMNSGNPASDVPLFNNVTAYTFACPNVAKYNENMSNYRNIYNFWFSTDIVPTVPLTNPADGWNFWKYGSCYTMDYPKELLVSFYYGLAEQRTKIDLTLNNRIYEELNKAFSQWETVEDYYNKLLFLISNNTTDPTDTDYTTLYEFLYNATAFMSLNHKSDGFTAITQLLRSPQLAPLACFAIKNINTIKKSHDFVTYDNVINGCNALTAQGSIQFSEYTYQDMTNGILLPMLMNEEETSENVTYNENEVQKLYSLASYSDNNDKLNWDLSDPSTWTGISWSSDGRVTSIDLRYKWLEGTIDCSNFQELVELDLYGNSLTSVLVNGDSNLISLDCSYNNLKNQGLMLNDCTALTELYCDCCNLFMLNLNNLTELETLSCAFNELIALNIENNPNLEHINCQYNYLDLYNNEDLFDDFDAIIQSNNAYVNYFPQFIGNNAAVNTLELQALKDFAEIGNNNSYLDWLDENGNISLRKVQNNVFFEFDGNEYRISYIDISHYNVSGSLDCSMFSYLKSLYCDNTFISSINLNGCNRLESIDCENSRICTLTLPTSANDLFYLSCENNHIDINTITSSLINSIAEKDEHTLCYRHQLINASVQDFNENDYNALCNLAQRNESVLGWDLTKPGEWDQVNWIYDTAEQKYRLLDCYFDCFDITGNLDLSCSERLENLSASGTDLITVSLPEMNVNDYAFYDCKMLEAVILKGGTSIGEGAFKFCLALQGVYVPNTVTQISEDAFAGSPNVTIAGNTDSFAESFCSDNGITFKSGYFLCGNVVTKENMKNTYQHYYSVEGVDVKSGGIVAATTDKYGYYVVFELGEGEYLHQFSYPYGDDLFFTASITDSPVIVTTPIGMVSFDWNMDSHINAKDYSMLSRHINGYQTGIDGKYYDINNDGTVDRNDWEFAENFFITGNADGAYNTQQSTECEYECMPLFALAAYTPSSIVGIDEVYGEDD